MDDSVRFTIAITPPTRDTHGNLGIETLDTAVRGGTHDNEMGSMEALAISVTNFLTALSDHLGESFEEVERLFYGLAFNLWGMVDSPEGWTTIALMFSSPTDDLPRLTPTIH